MSLYSSIAHVASTILDAVLPLRERAARTRVRQPHDIPLTPAVHTLLGVHITTLMDYRDSAVRDLVQSLKYDTSRDAARLAAVLLADYLREEVASLRQFGARRVLIIPVPLHSARARERGYNQIQNVLDMLPVEYRNGALAQLASHTLARTRATRPQTRLSRHERLTNVSGAFAASGGLSGAHVFLIDDVTTTGATLKHAGAALRGAGADVSLVALARA